MTTVAVSEGYSAPQAAALCCPQSAEEIWLHHKKDLEARSSSCLVSLLSEKKRKQTIYVGGISRSMWNEFMTARVVWQLPDDVPLKTLKNLRTGQRALLTLQREPLHANGPNGPNAHVYLKLNWYDDRAVPEELQIPIDFDALDCESIVARRMPFQLRHAVQQRQRPDEQGTKGPQGPLDVLLLLLGLLQEDVNRSFLKSKTRRYIATSLLPSRSSEHPVILRIPIDAIVHGRCVACGPQPTNKTCTSTLCSQLWHSRQGPETRPVDSQVAFSKGMTIHAAAARETVQRLDTADQGPSSSFDAADVEFHVSRAYGGSGASEKYAFLALLFASEGQREEFNGCLEQVFCSYMG